MTAEPDLRVTAVLTATPEAICAVWSSPELIQRWWGPAGFTSTVRDLDFTGGGVLDILMRAPDGTEFSNVYDFLTVEIPSRIEYMHRGSPEWGLSPSRTVVLIEAEAGDPARSCVSWLSFYASAEDQHRHLEDFNAESGARELLQRLEAVASAQAGS
ncbi:MAG: SRPBCC domain-containing protein [Aeromicrobium sp.]|uniref:SRPBCC domain-containing protein n=1 Tax=Aeromicrobium sp. TaxID=1871063 RepID=UPI0039E52F0A